MHTPHPSTPTPPPLVVDLQATTVQLRRLRHDLRDWATRAGLDADTVGAVELAAYEAMSNVADHAYRPDALTRPLRVAAVVGAAVVEVQISDQGGWTPPPADPGTRGHGLGLIDELADRSEIVATAAGTTVALAWLRPDTQPKNTCDADTAIGQDACRGSEPR